MAPRRAPRLALLPPLLALAARAHLVYDNPERSDDALGRTKSLSVVVWSPEAEAPVELVLVTQEECPVRFHSAFLSPDDEEYDEEEAAEGLPPGFPYGFDGDGATEIDWAGLSSDELEVQEEAVDCYADLEFLLGFPELRADEAALQPFLDGLLRQEKIRVPGADDDDADDDGWAADAEGEEPPAPEQIDLSEPDHEALLGRLGALPGLGPEGAAAVVGHLRAHGPLGSLDELFNVQGLSGEQVLLLHVTCTLGGADADWGAAEGGDDAAAAAEAGTGEGRAHDADRLLRDEL